MKKYIFLLLALASLLVTLNAQPLSDAKADYIWKTGYAGSERNVYWKHITFNPLNTIATMTATFDTASFSSTCATVCDSLGNLVCYTNGVFVYDRTNLKMRLDTLNPGYWARPPNYGIHYSFPQATLILPKPNNPNEYYLFHQKMNDPHPGAYSGEGFYYTTINSRLRNGLGGITSWRNVIVRDSFESGKINAVRHANGRDWWITCWHRYFTHYRLCLLDPSGVHDFGWQQVSTIPATPNYGQSCFSPDGTKFAAITYDYPIAQSRIDIFDFDRCNGVLSNHQQFWTPIINVATNGLSISPNSRYLYVSSPGDILQYDLQATNIPNSCDTVAHWDGFIDSTVVNAYLPVLFWTHQLAANGKIYISSGNGTFYMGRIDNPDERGVACNVRQHSVHLPAFGFRTVPNFPNFRLGPVDGSVCDTLGFNAVAAPAPPPKNTFIKAVPNPTRGMVYFENMPPKAHLVFYDVLGREVFCAENTPEVNMQFFPKGVYFCSIFGVNNQLLQTLKIVKIE